MSSVLSYEEVAIACHAMKYLKITLPLPGNIQRFVSTFGMAVDFGASITVSDELMCTKIPTCSTPVSVIAGLGVFDRIGDLDVVLHSYDGVAVPLPKLQALVATGAMIKVFPVANLEESGAPVGLGNLSPEGSRVVIKSHKSSTSCFRGMQYVLVRPARDSGQVPEPLLSNATDGETTIVRPVLTELCTRDTDIYFADASTRENVHDSGPCRVVTCNIFVVDRESITGTTYAAVFVDIVSQQKFVMAIKIWTDIFHAVSTGLKRTRAMFHFDSLMLQYKNLAGAISTIQYWYSR